MKVYGRYEMLYDIHLGTHQIISLIQFTSNDKHIIISSYNNTTADNSIINIISSKDGHTVWTKQYESEIINVIYGSSLKSNDDVQLISITQEGELFYEYQIPYQCHGYYDRMIDIRNMFLYGLHKRIGKYSYLQKLGGLEVLVKIIFEYLFHKNECSRNVISKRNFVRGNIDLSTIGHV